MLTTLSPWACYQYTQQLQQLANHPLPSITPISSDTNANVVPILHGPPTTLVRLPYHPILLILHSFRRRLRSVPSKTPL